MDLLLSKYFRDLTDEDITEVLLSSFPKYKTCDLSSFRSLFQFNTIMLAAICHPFSIATLGAFFGGGFGNVNTKLGRLEKKREIKKQLSNFNDMGAINGYVLDTLGEEECDIFGIDLYNKNKKRRNKNNRVSMHDYGRGVSLLSLVSMGKPLNYEKEYVFYLEGGAVKAGRFEKKKSSLCCDIVTVQKRGGRNLRLFIEQDADTEKNNELIEKFNAYHNLDIAADSGSNMVILSVHKPVNTSLLLVFSYNAVSKLCNIMKEYGFTSLKSFVTAIPKDTTELSANEITCAKRLSVVLGLGVCINRYENSTPIERINEKTEITFFPDKDASIEDVERYIKDLINNKNAYKLSYVVSSNQEKVRVKLFSCARLLFEPLINNENIEGTLLSLLTGRSLYICPSLMLGDTIDKMDFYNTYTKELSGNIVRNYYKEYDIESYEAISERISVAKGYAFIRLKNHFSKDNKHIAIEHLSCDLGCILRGLYLLHLDSKKVLGDEYNIIYLHYLDSEIQSFCELARRYAGNLSNNIRIYFLSYNDFESGNIRLKNMRSYLKKKRC